MTSVLRGHMPTKKRLDICTPGEAVLRVTVSLIRIDAAAKYEAYFVDPYTAILNLRDRLCLCMPESAIVYQLGAIALLMSAGYTADGAAKVIAGELRPKGPKRPG